MVSLLSTSTYEAQAWTSQTAEGQHQMLPRAHVGTGAEGSPLHGRAGIQGLGQLGQGWRKRGEDSRGGGCP